jgi:hypothetical protein
MMPPNPVKEEQREREFKIKEKNLVWVIVLYGVLMWAFGFAWGKIV